MGADEVVAGIGMVGALQVVIEVSEAILSLIPLLNCNIQYKDCKDKTLDEKLEFQKNM